MYVKPQIFIWGDHQSMSLPSEHDSMACEYEWRIVERPPVILNEMANGEVAAIIVDGDKTHTDPKALKTAFLQKGHPQPLIILISFFRLSAMAMALQYDYDEFLAKPIGPDQIRAMINKANQNTNQ